MLAPTGRVNAKVDTNEDRLQHSGGPALVASGWAVDSEESRHYTRTDPR